MNYIDNTIPPRNFNNINMTILEHYHVILDNEWQSKFISSSYTRIYIVLDGKGTLSFHNKDITITPNNIYIIPSGMEFKRSCEHLEMIYFHLTLTLQNTVDAFRKFKSCLILSDRKEFIKNLISNSKKQDITGVINIKSMLLNLVSECAAIYKTDLGKTTSLSEITHAALTYIENNLSASLTIEEIAEELFASPTRLQKQFKQETGTTIGKYIDSRVLSLAEQRLRMTAKSIRNLSDELGYSDQFYFSRKFSQAYGIPPMQYRKKHKK